MYIHPESSTSVAAHHLTMPTPNPILSGEANSPDSPPNKLSLVAAQASKITSVSLYSGRAEITRSFKLALVQGQNQITI